MKKIEIKILLLILVEAFFLLFSFKINLFSAIIGIIIGLILNSINHKIKKNNYLRILLIIISIPLLLLSLYKITLFINYYLLKNYSLIIISISLFIISIYLASKKYHTFIKITEIFFYIILFIKVIKFILCIPIININNIILSIKFDYQLIYISLFIIFLDNCLYYLNNYQLHIKETIISFANPLLIKIISISILGNTLSNIYPYPYVNYLRRIKYFDFIERMEGILSYEYLICFISLLCFLLIIIKSLKKPI